MRLTPAFGRAAVTTALLVAPSGPARADRAMALDEIVVSAPRLDTPLSRVPGAVSVVDRNQIQDGRQGLALDESLARVPGVFMQNRYNFAQDLRVSVRGFGARAPFGIRGVQILVDGIPATLPDGQASVDAIDLDAVSRIEVLRGSASSLYGNAAGGVIDITTARPPAAPFLGLASSAGAYGFFKHTLQAGGQAGNLGVAATVSDMTYDGFRDHSATESTKLNARVRYVLGENSDVTLVARAVDSPQAGDPGALTAEEIERGRNEASPGNLRFNAGEQLDEQQLGLVYRRGFGQHHELRLRGYSVRRDFANRLPFTDGGQVAFDRRFNGIGMLYTLEAPILGLDNRLLLGADLKKQHDDRQRYDNLAGARGDLVLDQLETVTGTGAFVQNELELSDRLTVTAGLRHDSVRFEVDDRFSADGFDDSGRRTLGELSPKLGATYFVSPRFIPYANISRSFETPTTTEFARCRGGGFVDTLDAQEAIAYELGASGRAAPGLRYGVAVYHGRGRDEIVSRACPGQPGREFFVNAGRTTRNGLELSLEAEPAPRWTASLAYTFSDFEFDRFRSGSELFDGNTVPGTPEHALFAEVIYRHEAGWFLAADARYNDRVFANNANTVRDDASLVTNLRAGFEKQIGKWRVDGHAGVNNVSGERYNNNVRINAFGGRFFEPAPGRNVFAGLTIRRNLPAPW